MVEMEPANRPAIRSGVTGPGPDGEELLEPGEGLLEGADGSVCCEAGGAPLVPGSCAAQEGRARAAMKASNARCTG